MATKISTIQLWDIGGFRETICVFATCVCGCGCATLDMVIHIVFDYIVLGWMYKLPMLSCVNTWHINIVYKDSKTCSLDFSVYPIHIWLKQNTRNTKIQRANIHLDSLICQRQQIQVTNICTCIQKQTYAHAHAHGCKQA